MVAKNLQPSLLRVLLRGSFLAVVCITMNACSKVPIDNKKVEPNAEGVNIAWDVLSVAKSYTRGAMINSLNELKIACTPTDETYEGIQGRGNAIGFWVDMYDHNEHILIKDIFDANQTKLSFFDKPHSDQVGVHWNYEGNDKKWILGGEYKFRAFYPQNMSQYIVRSATNADFFAMQYNSHIMQEDLMVAYNHVFTRDPVTGNPSIAIGEGNNHSEIVQEDGKEGYSLPFTISSAVPVPLHFKHTLAAVRMRFAFDYEENDELQSVYLVNNTAGQFHTLGILVYGDGVSIDYDDDIANSTEDNLLSAAGSAATNSLDIDSDLQFGWISYHTLLDNEAFYRWEIADGGGIPFNQTVEIVDGHEVRTDSMAVAFSPTVRQVVRVTTEGSPTSPQEEEIVGTTPLPTVKQTYPRYNENDGWFFIIPQNTARGLTCHFTTKKMGEIVVEMPTVTGTDKDGNLSPTGDYFLPGYRYTYTVKLNKSNSDISLSISDWDERYVVQNIDF